MSSREAESVREQVERVERMAADSDSLIWDFTESDRESLETVLGHRAALLEAAKHAAMEWRLHGQLTDSCRVLEAAIGRAEKH